MSVTRQEGRMRYLISAGERLPVRGASLTWRLGTEHLASAVIELREPD